MHIDLSDYLTQPLSSLIAALESVSPKPVLGDLRLRDLARPRDEVTGLYAFFERSIGLQNWMYVGKCSSRSFIGRMSAHCDPRDDDYDMNNFVKAIKRKDNLPFVDAQNRVLDATVVFVEVPQACTPGITGRERSNAIGRLERRIQRAVATRYNEHPKTYDARKPEKTYLTCSVNQILTTYP